MASQDITRSIAKLTEYFDSRNTRAAVVARRVVGRSRPTDAELVEHLTRELRRRTRMDGSVGGSLHRTAWTAWELLELGYPGDHAAVVRTVGYVLATEDRPGHFGEGCSDEQHERRTCLHFLSGFFSPGPRDVPVAPLELPSGLTIRDEDATRFAASCVALRTVLRAGEDRRGAVRRHVESLISLSDLWHSWSGVWSPDLAFCALGALAHAPYTARPQVEALAAALLGRQQRDGRWPGAHLYHALDMLLGLRPHLVRDAATRAAPLLTAVCDDAAADELQQEERALIAVRTLMLAG